MNLSSGLVFILMEQDIEWASGMPMLFRLGSWEAVLHSGKMPSHQRERTGSSCRQVASADLELIIRVINGNYNIYPTGLSWGLKEMHSAWNTTDLQSVVATVILAVYLCYYQLYFCILFSCIFFISRVFNAYIHFSSEIHLPNFSYVPKFSVFFPQFLAGFLVPYLIHWCLSFCICIGKEGLDHTI